MGHPVSGLGARSFVSNTIEKTGGRQMQNAQGSLRPAQAEVHRTAHDQDLIEVPKRAWLDREAEGKREQEARTGDIASATKTTS
jgi:hypothetical protein